MAEDVNIKVGVDSASVAQAAAAGDKAAQKAMAEHLREQKRLTTALISSASKLGAFDGKIASFVKILAGGGPATAIGAAALLVTGFKKLLDAVNESHKQLAEFADALEKVADRESKRETREILKDGVTDKEAEDARNRKAALEKERDRLENFQTNINEANKLVSSDEDLKVLRGRIMEGAKSRGLWDEDDEAKTKGKNPTEVVEYVLDKLASTIDNYTSKIADQDKILDAYNKQQKKSADEAERQDKIFDKVNKQLVDDRVKRAKEHDKAEKDRFQQQLDAAKSSLFSLFQQLNNPGSTVWKHDTEYKKYQDTPEFDKIKLKAVPKHLTSLAQQGIYMGETKFTTVEDKSINLQKSIRDYVIQIARNTNA